MTTSDDQKKVTPLRRELISGFSSGILTILITHPLDLVKVRLQLSKDANATYRSIIKNTFSLPIDKNVSAVIRSRAQSMYKGLSINLIGNSYSWGLYFFLYRLYKDQLSGLNTSHLTTFQRDKQMNGMHYMLAAWSAGFTTTLLTNPIWVLKTRTMSPNISSAESSHRSISKLATHIYKTEGLSAFFRGLLPSVIGVSQGAVYFSIYDTLRVKFLNQADGSEKPITPYESISITSTAKMISTLLLYPIQTIKTNMQDYGMEKRGVIETVVNIYRRNHGGLRNLYRGIGANLARSLPATCITFYTYETVKRSLP
ncbi:hypothetical protein QEN19_004355 [Hanseniaspora menglaensis]